MLQVRKTDLTLTIVMKEKDLYKPIITWLRHSMPKNKNDKIYAFDCSKHYLSDIILSNSLNHYFKNYTAFQIKPDLVCFKINTVEEKYSLCIVEVKLGLTALGHACQLLGYSLICNPD